MSRREWVACAERRACGPSSELLSLAATLSSRWSSGRRRQPRNQRPRTSSRCSLVLPLPFVGAILACALLNFAEVHGLAGPQRRRRAAAAAVPLRPSQDAARHRRDPPAGRLAVRAAEAGSCLPEKGMYTGVLITGATGSAKTSAAQYPFTAQLIHLHADDPARKMGGLIIDAKGNYADFVRDQCALAGRLPRLLRGQPDQRRPLEHHRPPRPQRRRARRPHRRHDRERPGDVPGRSLLAPGGEGPGLPGDPRPATGGRAGADDGHPLPRGHVLRGLRGVREARREAGEHGEQHEELASIKFWLEAKAAKLDAKLRASIAAGLNGVCSLFDDPEDPRGLRAPTRCWRTSRASTGSIEEGQIVALRVPKSQLKTVSTIVGTMTKLNFFDAVLNRLARAEHGSGDVGRGVFFVADEYDGYTTQPGDGDFFSKCREAKCCARDRHPDLRELRGEAQERARGRPAPRQPPDQDLALRGGQLHGARRRPTSAARSSARKVSRSRNETVPAQRLLVPRRRRDRRRLRLGRGGDLDQPPARAPLHAARLHEPHGQPGHREGASTASASSSRGSST